MKVRLNPHRAFPLLLVLTTLGGVVACTRSQTSPSQEDSLVKGAAKGDAPHETTASPSGTTEVPQAAPKPMVGPPPPPRDPQCVVLERIQGKPPAYATGRGVVLTRILETCLAMDGRRGYTKKTPWLAMGFPCTGGSGRIDIKGHYHNPKLVSFVIGTDCAMAPSNHDQVKQIATTEFSLPPEARLMAYNPFVVQFWEIPGMTDSDTGYAIDLRSAPAIEGLWKKVRENQSFRVRLFGRENTWAPGGDFYQVEADVRLTGRHAFQITVASVKALSSEELRQLKMRCEALRPERNCGAVF